MSSAFRNAEARYLRSLEPCRLASRAEEFPNVISHTGIMFAGIFFCAC